MLQTSLLPTGAMPTAFARLPGLRYQADFLSAHDEAALTRTLADLPLERFKFRQYLGNRRVQAFGYRYDFTRRALEDAPPLPAFLEDVRGRAAAFAGVHRDAVAQEQVLEYAPGAGIGWHRDKPEFGIVIGVSLGAPAVIRFRRADGDGKWVRGSQLLEPRSIYVMSGAVRHEWEHSIAPQTALRYSLIFRTLAGPASGG